MSLATSLSVLSLALSITGSPLEVRNSSITLPLTRRLNFSNGTINSLQHDKARVAALRGYNTHDRRAYIVPLTSSFLDYTPPKTYNLVVDVGSSNTWVGASIRYTKTGTSFDTGRRVEVNYGSDSINTESSFVGMIYRDTITVTGGLTVTNFQIGVASTSSGFDPFEDGILGLGPEDLTRKTMPDDLDGTIPTFTDCLYDQGKIDQRVVGIFFQPVTMEPDSRSGELTFGGIDYTKFMDDIAYTPITAMPPSSRYWGINQRITYGATTILGATAAGVVDTGSTYIWIASDAYDKYKAATGGTLDRQTGLLTITSDQYNLALQNLDFHIDGKIFSLTPNAQIWPRSLNLKLEGLADPHAIYLIVTNIGKHSGAGLDFIIGYPFIQRFYTVLDGSRSRVGFAKTQFTDATTN
ncbi:aspartic proteinase [Suillus spraguei]|nr:aspartic proteinase [Suillus spraguei]